MIADRSLYCFTAMMQGSDEEEAVVAGSGSPEWGWGVKGWDGPASKAARAPRGVGSAGGVEGEDLVPPMPPHIKHYMIVADNKGRTVRRG